METNFTDTQLEKIIVHEVGNKNTEGALRISKAALQTDEMTGEILKTFFLNPFKDVWFYNFFHEDGLENHPLMPLIDRVFENSDTLYTASVELARRLHQFSEHPNIKTGEFYVAYFQDCLIEDEVIDAIGLFKSENKETFLQVYPQSDTIQVQHHTGISVNKLDKACLIFNTEKEFGYKICVVDKTNKKNEAHYWKDDFLGVLLRKDDFYQTQNYLQICKGFVEDVFNPKNDVERTEQIELLNKSIQYFKNNDNFSEDDFKKTVMRGESAVIDAFDQYKDFYKESNSLELDQDFGIAKTAVKKEQRNFKSVLKLDKNFHIYIHGDRNRIKKGFDENKGLNFYQVFFELED